MAGSGAAAPAPHDEALVDRALAGDREAFGLLVHRHQRGVSNYLYRLTGSRDVATDLAQDVFVKVYQGLPTFDPSYRFTTWLYKIASNCAIDHLRRQHTRTLSLTQIGGDDESPSEPSIPGNEPSPHDVLRLRELESRLDASIRELPTSYQQLLMLRHRHHCRYDEIAKIARLPIGTVKNRLFRAREILRERLADLLDGEA